MLRKQNYTVTVGEVQYVAPPLTKCVTKSEKIAKYKKIACGDGVLKPTMVDEEGITHTKVIGNMLNDLEQLTLQSKENACNPNIPSCVKRKTCLAKTSVLHDGTENVSMSDVGLGLKADGNDGLSYNTFREVSIIDTDEMIRNMRTGQAPYQDQVTKEAEYNARQFGASHHSVDGMPTGYACNICPPKPKVCRTKFCKKQDPINNPIVGIGSDALQSQESLLTLYEARRVKPELASFLAQGTPLPQKKEEEEEEPEDMDFGDGKKGLFESKGKKEEGAKEGAKKPGRKEGTDKELIAQRLRSEMETYGRELTNYERTRRGETNSARKSRLLIEARKRRDDDHSNL